MVNARCRHVVLHSNIKTGGLLDELRAWIEITMKRDGTVRFQGHAHNDGLEGLDFNIITIIRTLTPRAVSMKPFSGHVSGTIGRDLQIKT